MLGAIIGDIVGSVYEFSPVKTKHFALLTTESRFTDDTVLTIAVSEWILEGGDLGELMRKYVTRYPQRGYGSGFYRWARDPVAPAYNSFGNGAAMRVSPVGFAFEDINTVLDWAARSAEVTHNHPEGIRGAQAVAAAVFHARSVKDKSVLRYLIESQSGYDLSDRLDDIRPEYQQDITCRGSVPQAMIAFLESADYEDAIRNAISLGGDADTQACIAGGIAEAYYGGVPPGIARQAVPLLDRRMISVLRAFRTRYGL